MSNPIIEIENLGKKYRIGALREPYLSLRDSVAHKAKHAWNVLRRKEHVQQKQEDFWALKDVSFSVNEGEAVGIIGRNGAGKSTLLKILSQITPPTEGKITMRGRVASLLEVGTGFHPELSGRENIFLNGAILGMTRKEIRRKFDEIVAFAEIEMFLDTPVKRYSSGMYVRLAFAVAAHLEPEILVVDEVLAVGDAQFQKKCLGKMQDVAKGGRTVLFVSHNMAAIEGLCSKAVLLEKGLLQSSGLAKNVIEAYLEDVLPHHLNKTDLRNSTDRSGTGDIRLVDFWIENNAGKKVAAVSSGKDCVFALEYESAINVQPKNIDVGISLSSPSGSHLVQLYSSYVGQVFNDLPQTGVFRCQVPKLPLGPNRYTVGGRLTANEIEADNPISGVGYLVVEAGDFYGTGKGVYHPNIPLLLDGTWDTK
ncbi:MAG: ABC transporter ATP-binding protein [Candidatus Sabulitectum sp.]|nr:ABC transporter ATP-binding protein [Candidatus Sabulitectum sp.]